LRYDAFISYSHSADDRLASELHKALHRFAKPWNRLRAIRVFRDRTDLSVSPSLWNSVENALAESKHLILLATPAAASSKWVQREINYWRRHRSPETLLIVLTEGECKWDESQSDFDWQRTNALPTSLSKYFANQPRHLDLRWARNQHNLSLRHRDFRDAVSELAAPLHGKRKSELESEDIRARKKARMWARLAVCGLAILALSTTIGAYIAVQTARAERAARLEAESRELASLALFESDPVKALVFAIESIERRETVEAQRALWMTIQKPYFPTTITVDGMPVAWSLDKRFVLLENGEESTLWNTETGEQLVAITSGISATFSPDSGKLIVGSTDDSIRCWSTASGARLPNLLNAFAPTRRLIYSPTGKQLVAISAEGITGVIDAETGNTIWVSPNDVDVARYSADGQFLLTVTSSGEAQVWNNVIDRPNLLMQRDGLSYSGLSATGRWFWGVSERGSWGIWETNSGREIASSVRVAPDTVRMIWGRRVWPTFSDDERLVAILGADGMVHVIDLVTGRGVRSFAGSEREIDVVVSFSPDSQRIAIGGESIVRLWNLKTGQEIAALRGYVRGVNQIAFTKDGSKLLAAGDRMTRIWDIDSSSEFAMLPGSAITHADFTPDAKGVVTASSKGRILQSGAGAWRTTISNWRMFSSPFTILRRADAARCNTSIFSGDGFHTVGFSDKGDLVFAASRVDVQVWNTQTGNIVASVDYSGGAWGRALGGLRHAKISLNGHRMIIADHESAVIWDIGTGRITAPLKSQSIEGVAFLSDGSPVVISRNRSRDSLYVTHLGTGEVLMRMKSVWKPSWKREIDSRGNTMAVWEDSSVIHVWDLAKGEKKGTLQNPLRTAVQHLTTDPTGRRVLSTGSGPALIWDLTTGSFVKLDRHTGSVSHAEFNRDGQLIVTASEDSTARVWNAATGEQLFSLERHEYPLSHASFSSEGNYIITTDEAGITWLWDTRTGQDVAEFATHDGYIFDAAFSLDGRWAATAGSDCTVRLYPLRIRDLIEAGKLRLPSRDG